MALELYYTSSPRGLRPGTSGLCTVAMTRSMSAALASRLESLCGYRPPGEGIPIDRWPSALSHWIVDVGGVERHVLAAVRPVKPDHTMRSNTLAHFAVLHQSELDAAGAAWMLAQPETSAAAWSGEPRLLDAERAMPRGGPAGARACMTWKSVAGDAGWAGVLANAAMLDPTKPATVIYPPGVRALDLVAEAMALLPAAYRWRVTFTTYFTQPLAGVRCTWRFCLDGTSAAAAARQAGGLVIDACAPHPCTRTGEFVDAARAGRDPVLAAPAGQPHGASRVAPERLATVEPGPPAFEYDSPRSAESRRRVPSRQPVGADEPAPSGAASGRTALAVAVVATITLLAIVAVLAVLIRTMSIASAELEARAAKLEQERDALEQSGAQADGLRSERDEIQRQLSLVKAERDELEAQKRKSDDERVRLQMRLNVVEDAESARVSTGKPPESPPVADPPTQPRDDGAAPPANDGVRGSGSDGPSATGVPASRMIRHQQATRQESVAASTPQEDIVGTVDAPSVVAMQDTTVRIAWTAAQSCGADTVTLEPSTALASLGFALRDGDRLAFAGGDGLVDVARISLDGGSFSWTWMSGGTTRVKSWLDAQQMAGPEGWAAILGQVRLTAMCADRSQRTALMAPPRVMPWRLGQRSGERFSVDIPAAFASKPVLEWMGEIVEVRSDTAATLGPADGPGTVSARLTPARPSDMRARISLEWIPSDLERGATECIRALDLAIAKEREIEVQWSRASKWSASLGSPPQGPRLLGPELAAAEAGLKVWQSERAASLDRSKRDAFEAQPLDKRVREYASSLWESRLKPARDEITVQRASCDDAVSAWHASMAGQSLLLRPDHGSPPIVRISVESARKVPELPFAPSGPGAGAASGAVPGAAP